MFIYRIMGMSRSDCCTVARYPEAHGEANPERVVVFSDTLVLESYGWCAIIQDKPAKQTKYLFMGEPCCHECGKCPRPPLLVDTIQVAGQSTGVELKSRQMIVAHRAKEYCHTHGITMTVTHSGAGSVAATRPSAPGSVAPHI